MENKRLYFIGARLGNQAVESRRVLSSSGLTLKTGWGEDGASPWLCQGKPTERTDTLGLSRLQAQNNVSSRLYRPGSSSRVKRQKNGTFHFGDRYSSGTLTLVFKDRTSHVARINLDYDFVGT